MTKKTTDTKTTSSHLRFTDEERTTINKARRILAAEQNRNVSFNSFTVEAAVATGRKLIKAAFAEKAAKGEVK